jgi:hypothetical protein
MHMLSVVLCACIAGMKNRKDGYEGLIEAALAISALFRVDQQWDTVASALQRAFPSYILTMASIYIYTHLILTYTHAACEQSYCKTRL